MFHIAPNDQTISDFFYLFRTLSIQCIKICGNAEYSINECCIGDLIGSIASYVNARTYTEKSNEVTKRFYLFMNNV